MHTVAADRTLRELKFGGLYMTRGTRQALQKELAGLYFKALSNGDPRDMLKKEAEKLLKATISIQR